MQRGSSNTELRAYVAELESEVQLLSERVIELKRQLATVSPSMEDYDEQEFLAERSAKFLLPPAPTPKNGVSLDAEDASLKRRLGIAFLIGLLEGRLPETAETFEFARAHNLHLEYPHKVCIFVLDVPLPLNKAAVTRRELLGNRLANWLEQGEYPSLCSVSLNRVRFLLPAYIRAETIWKYFQSSDISLIVGKSHTGLGSIKLGYDEVSALAPHVTFGQYYDLEKLLLQRILMGDITARAEFIASLFAPLQNQKSGNVLIETLVVLARHDFRQNLAAETLHIHPKTMRYRLDRVAEQTHLDLEDPDTRFQLQLAARLLSIRDKDVP